MDKNEIMNISEEDKVEVAISMIQDAINTNDMVQINSYVNQIGKNIRNLLKDCNKDLIICLMDRFFNRIITTFPSIRVEACERFDDELVGYMNNIEYEKYALNEVKKYLKYCSRYKVYDDLALSFGILIAILVLHNDRNERMKTSIDVWDCGIKGIRYIPVVRNDKTDDLINAINGSLSNLKRRK